MPRESSSHEPPPIRHPTELSTDGQHSSGVHQLLSRISEDTLPYHSLNNPPYDHQSDPRALAESNQLAQEN